MQSISSRLIRNPAFRESAHVKPCDLITLFPKRKLATESSTLAVVSFLPLRRNNTLLEHTFFCSMAFGSQLGGRGM